MNLSVGMFTAACIGISSAFAPPLSKHRVLVRISAVTGSDSPRAVVEVVSSGDDDNTQINQLSEIYVDDECSLDNLDACLQGPIEDELCALDDLDLCQSDVQIKPPQSLKAFLSQPIIEVQLAFLVVLSSLFVGIGTVYSIPPTVMAVTHYGELTISAIFAVEYIARWKVNNFSAKYLIEPLAIIDLLAILPGAIKFSYLCGLSVPPALLGGALINLRLLRILRLQNVLKDFDTFKKFESALGLQASDIRPYQLQLARVVIDIFTILSITAGLIYSAEKNVNPEITDYFSALYFAIITLTTVGYGDIHPVTTAGRWIVSGAIFVGIAVVPAQAAALLEALYDREGEKNLGRTGSSGTTNVKANETSSEESYEALALRLSRLEEKVDRTNDRIEKLIEVIESSHK